MAASNSRGRRVVIEAEPEDHRVRTGAVRREATRRKLLSAAVEVFAKKGPDAASIDDFLAAAGVARGTFYNYFKTTSELLDAVTAELNDEVILAIEACVSKIDSPIERVWIGCQMFIRVAVMHPAWGAFITRTGVRDAASGRLTKIYLPRDLAAALECGMVKYANARAAHDLLLGAIHQSIETVLTGAAPADHPKAVMELVFGALGVARTTLNRLMKQPLPDIDLPDGLKSLEAAVDESK
ncbi:TetR family transcriptional regulator [Burkholderia pseudomultivorans]|uniref:TetR family transcriptional regulator n=1 Tax=Burkholderia pseudomultivorans TaxID=1207504 RepID=A0A6P2MMS1_9BURK|nr:TetR family transcriptional regulator [Burkholderia pseudomultivorans]